MIANPWLSALRYNPYDRTLTREAYDTPKMHQLRSYVPPRSMDTSRLMRDSSHSPPTSHY